MLASVYFKDWSLVFTINIFLIILLVVIPLICFWSKIKQFVCNICVSTVKVKILEQEIEIKPNYQVKQIAYAFWVELQTRKLGLPIDLNHDVIVELYNSWYSFFNITRTLIKDIPAEKTKDENTQKLINVALEVLNNAVRPHLTKWQARFRKWYDEELKTDEGKKEHKSPQYLQRKFYINNIYNYEELSKDMLNVNQIIINYKKTLEKIVFGKEIINEKCEICSIPEMIKEDK